MFKNPFFQTKLDYSGRDQLIKQISAEYEKAPTKKPASWEENVHTSIVYEDYENNLDYFQKSGIPLDLVVEIDKIVQLFVIDLDIADIGTFYIAEMWYNAYANAQFQQPHKHSNKTNMMFSGVYYIKFNKAEHSATRFYNPYFDINFKKVSNNPFFVTAPDINENDVLIFPSDVGHDVLEQNSKDLRITVAFNVGCIFKEEAKSFTYG
jgi:uncharacterized protein (TIGR02466 family)